MATDKSEGGKVSKIIKITLKYRAKHLLLFSINYGNHYSRHRVAHYYTILHCYSTISFPNWVLMLQADSECLLDAKYTVKSANIQLFKCLDESLYKLQVWNLKLYYRSSSKFIRCPLFCAHHELFRKRTLAGGGRVL